MLDVKTIHPQITRTFKALIGGEPVEITLTLRPADLSVVDYGKIDQAGAVGAATFELCRQGIVGWGLTDNGQPVPCNDETKAKYLGLLVSLPVEVVVDDKPVTSMLGVEVVVTAGDLKNFFEV